MNGSVSAMKPEWSAGFSTAVKEGEFMGDSVLFARPRVTIQLPLDLDALWSAESQVDFFLEKLGLGRHEFLRFALRLAVNEGFRNALMVRPVDNRMSVIELSLAAVTTGIEVRITDPGPGFKIKDTYYPPYPNDMIGCEFEISSLMGQTLIAKIASPTALRFRMNGLKQSDLLLKREDLLDGAGSKGMGLISLCHEFDEVGMFYHYQDGNSLCVFYEVDWDCLKKQFYN